MLLAIDVGNTNIVFAVFQNQNNFEVFRIETNRKITVEDFYEALKTVNFSMIENHIISSVVPEVNDVLREFCTTCLGQDARFVSHTDVPVAQNIKKPQEIGADRLVNAAAVTAYYQAPAIVLDFGTATTFDVIDANGAYAGGIIAPGVNLSLEVLERAASQLPKIELQKPQSVIGLDTVSAMQAGAYYGYLGLIERIILEIREETHVPPYVIATGGLASLFANDNPLVDCVDPDLTLKGLYSLGTQ